MSDCRCIDPETHTIFYDCKYITRKEIRNCPDVLSCKKYGGSCELISVEKCKVKSEYLKNKERKEK